MSNIGVWIETDENGIKAANYGVVTAAKSGGKVVALICGEDGEAFKEALAAYGVETVVVLPAAGPEGMAAALAAAVEQYSLKALLGLASARGRDLLARCACRLDAPLVLDATAVDFAARTAEKSHFSGRTMATLQLAGDVAVIGLRPNVIEAREAPASAELLRFEGETADDGRLQVVENRKGKTGAVDLTEAEIIITGGRPLDSADNFGILHACAEQLGAAVGASRAAVDAGFAPHSMQVGQTGKTVSPRLYIGCGLSGSVQHFAGMKTSKVIVGINTDKDAPIFGKCDYGIVGDLFEVVPALTEALRSRKG